MNRVFTQKEARAMRGKVFDYTDGEGYTGKLFVADVDLMVGLTAKVYKQPDSDRPDCKEEGRDMLCVNLSLGLKGSRLHSPERLQLFLNWIDTGHLKEDDVNPEHKSHMGNLNCAFK